MEWVETTAKTIEAAREAALDQLGVAADEAEFDVIEEPRPGLFGRVRGEARLRARVRPAQVRPKQERRRRSKSDRAASNDSADTASSTSGPADTETTRSTTASSSDSADTADSSAADAPSRDSSTRGSSDDSTDDSTSSRSRRRSTPKRSQETTMTTDDRPESTVTPDEVGAAAVAFMEGLTHAFGNDADVAVHVDGIELDVTVTGTELGLLVGPGGRTLDAVQDLARVAAQRRLGDHETRLRVDVAGYRERREAALASFANDVAEQVISSGTARSLEPMTSADRKVIHDVLNEIDGVTTRSVGEDPDRRIIVEPA
jgi:spoIIIJ-associated protein